MLYENVYHSFYILSFRIQHPYPDSLSVFHLNLLKGPLCIEKSHLIVWFLISTAFRLSRESESLMDENRIIKKRDFGYLTSVAAFKILHQRNVRPDLISLVIRGQRPLGGTFFLLKVRTGSGWQGKGRSRSRTGHPLCNIQFPLRDGNRGDTEGREKAGE